LVESIRGPFCFIPFQRIGDFSTTILLNNFYALSLLLPFEMVIVQKFFYLMILHKSHRLSLFFLSYLTKFYFKKICIKAQKVFFFPYIVCIETLNYIFTSFITFFKLQVF
jgi:hypothetical protein